MRARGVYLITFKYLTESTDYTVGLTVRLSPSLDIRSGVQGIDCTCRDQTCAVSLPARPLAGVAAVCAEIRDMHTELPPWQEVTNQITRDRTPLRQACPNRISTDQEAHHYARCLSPTCTSCHCAAISSP